MIIIPNQNQDVDNHSTVKNLINTKIKVVTPITVTNVVHSSNPTIVVITVIILTDTARMKTTNVKVITIKERVNC